MRNRRSFILSTGALAAYGTVGSASAKTQNEVLTDEEFLREFQSSYRKGGVDAVRNNFGDIAIESLEPNGGDSDPVSPQAHDQQSITPQEAFSKSDSELSVASQDIGDDKVRVTVNMALDGYKPTVRNSWWIDDAIVISYTEGDWAAIGEPTVSADDPHSAEFTTKDVEKDAVAGSVDIDRVYPDGPYLVTLVSSFKLRDDSVASRFWGGYAHTIATDPWGSVESISGETRGISVEVDTRASIVWDPALPLDPRDDV